MIGLPYSRGVLADGGAERDMVVVLPSREFTLGLPVPKATLEANQMTSFVAAWCALQRVSPSDVVVTARDDLDDHDFDMTVGSETFEVELTALLTPVLRDERRRIFSLGQAVQARLNEDAELATALIGLEVLLRDEASTLMPAGTAASAATTSRIVDELRSWSRNTSDIEKPKSFIEKVDGIGIFLGPSEQTDPSSSGSQQVGGVIASPETEQVPVRVATSNTSTTVEATQQAVVDAIVGKDIKSRTFVVLIAGDLSRDGLELPVEVAEYELIQRYGLPPLPALRHVQQAWLHLAGTSQLMRLL